MTAEARRRIAALDLARTSGYGPRPITTPGLISAAPDKYLNPRTDI
jgi:hypothetical protein